MLRSGGRLFLYNVGTNHTGPYTILTPLWFYDYFIGNGFSRVLVYASVFKKDGGTDRNVFLVEPQSVAFLTPNITSAYSMTLLVLAERAGADIITMTPELIAKLPMLGKDLAEFSLDTVQMFYRDAQAAGYVL